MRHELGMPDAAAPPAEGTVRERVVSWLREHLPAEWVAAVDGGDEDTVEQLRGQLDYDEWCRCLGEAGWATPTWPVEYSGAGLTSVEAKVMEAELARYRVPRSFNLLGLGLVGPTLLQWGTEEQKLRYLPAIAQHREIWCQLFSEPGAGSDLAALATRAVPDGSTWVVSGQKVWTTLAHRARRGLLVARTDPEQPKHSGLTCFVVDMEARGVDVRPLRQMTGDAEFNEVFLDGVAVPDEDRVGSVGQGWAVATTTLMNERVAIGEVSQQGKRTRGASLGGVGIDLLLAEARANGTLDPALRDRLVQAYIGSRVLGFLNQRAGAARRAGRPPGPEGSISKLLQAQHNQRVQNLSIDLLGADGGAWLPIDEGRALRVRGFLRSRANTIEGGTSEVMRTILGERVLGLPKEPAADRGVPWKDVPRSH